MQKEENNKDQNGDVLNREQKDSGENQHNQNIDL